MSSFCYFYINFFYKRGFIIRLEILKILEEFFDREKWRNSFLEEERVESRRKRNKKLGVTSILFMISFLNFIDFIYDFFFSIEE
jgi:hypothetical protein